MSTPQWWTDRFREGFGWGFLAGVVTVELLLLFALYGRID